MKRAIQMKDAGIPVAGMRPDHFKGFRGVGRPKREWQPGLLVVEHPERRKAKPAPEPDFHAKATILPVLRKSMFAKIAALFRRLFRV
jgi:hypothetical protein